MRSLYEKWLAQLAVSRIDPSLTLPHPNSISTDSRTILPGQWFLPLSGEKFDGHRYIDATVEKTGAGFFYEAAKVGMISPRILARGIAVTSTLECLQAIALGWRQEQKHLTVVALTGSVGKTTTREIAKAIFSTQGKTHGTEGNFNNEIGLPLTLLRIKEDDKFSILELGARHVGDIAFLCKISDPDIVACLNIGVSHLGEFGTILNLFAAKMEIFSGRKTSTKFVCPSDDERITSHLQHLGRRYLGFGYSDKAEIRVLESHWLAGGGMNIKISSPGLSMDFKLGLGHEAYPINVSAAIAMAYSAGIPISAISDSLSSFTGLVGRYCLIKLAGKTIIDDCYNAAPQSMRAGLTSIALAFPGCKKVLILGDMLELGPTSDLEHFTIGQEISKIDSLSLLVTVGESGRIIGKGAISAGINPSAVISYSDVSELIANMGDVSGAGEIIYVKASNGVGLKKFLDHLRQGR